MNYSANFRPVVKSRQAGTISITTGLGSNTATITAVMTGKTRLNFLGVESATTDFQSSMAYLELVNSTTVRATRGSTNFDTVIRFEAVEYY